MHPAPKRRRLLLTLLAVLLAGCNAPLALGATPTPAATATATVTPTLTPTPTPAPEVRLSEADQALLDGDWDAALAAYTQARAQASDPERQAEAQFGIGAALLRAGRAGEADEALTGYVTSFPNQPRAAQAYLLRAIARQAEGQNAAAVDDYAQYLAQRPGRIDAYVQEKMGDALRQAQRPLEAVAHYRAAVDAPRLGDALGIRIKIGRALLEGGDAAGALAEFDALYQAAGDDATKATANYLAGLALEAQGNLASAHARYLDSVKNFPQAFDAYSGLLKLVDAGVPVENFQRGLVDYNAGALAPALEAFNRAWATAPSGTVLYYRGLTKADLGDALGAQGDLRRVVTGYPADPHRTEAWLALGQVEWADLDQAAQAVQTYLDFVAALPAAPEAAQALFLAGRAAERGGDLTRAATIWLRLPAEYPGTAQAFQGAFQAGVARFRQQGYPPSGEAFQQAESIATDPEQRAASWLWLGKCRQAQGDDAGARQAWQTAADADPTGYYSLRAADLLAGRAPFQANGVPDFATNLQAEQQEAEAWLRSKFTLHGPEPLSALDPGLAGDLRMVRGEEFLQLGLFGEAKDEFEALRKAVENDPEATYRLMHRLLELHLYQPAIYAARQILRLAGMDDAATASAPAYFNHIRFGAYFGELILPEAARNNLDGLFLLSVVRQESLFEGFATSYAAARGLMQIIPSTGEALARQLGWPPGYSDQDLFRPIVSVRLGSLYLTQQRDRFNGDLFAALAAYNAGPGNAQIWKDLAPNDPDLFLEVIRLAQPQQYIQTIYEVFARYRDLYTPNT